MTKRIRIVLSLILCFMFVGALGTGPTAQAAPNMPPQHQLIYSQDGNAVGSKATDKDAAVATTQWTLEKRQAAKPLEVTMNAADFKTMASADAAGAPVFNPGKMADPAALEKAKTQYPDAWSAMENRQAGLNLPTLEAPSLVTPQGTKSTGVGYPGNYWYDFWDNYPFYTVGRLYFDDGYTAYWCTAALISPNSVVVTAAHCIYNTDFNFQYENWWFQPDDTGGYAPLGSYPYYSWWVNGAWVNAKSASKGAAYDVGVMNFYYDPSYYGWMGWGYNWNAKNLRHTIGYTTNFTGAYYTWVCVAESFTKGSLIGGGCGMNNTAGGSPSILGFYPFYMNTSYYNWVDAVVYGGSDGSNIYSARFTTKNITLICYIIGC